MACGIAQIALTLLAAQLAAWNRDLTKAGSRYLLIYFQIIATKKGGDSE